MLSVCGTGKAATNKRNQTWVDHITYKEKCDRMPLSRIVSISLQTCGNQRLQGQI
jgi:hypothetical protein